MSPRQRWLGLSLVLWGIPAFLSWLLIGAFLHLQEQRTDVHHLEMIKEAMTRIMTDSWPIQSFWRRLPQEAKRLPELPADPIQVNRYWETTERSFPPGSIRMFLFDRQGRLVSPASPKVGAAAQRLFDILRSPPASFPDLGDPLLEPATELLVSPRAAIEVIRKNPGGVIWLPDQRPPFPDHGFFSWQPSPDGGPIAGMLALIDSETLAPDLGLLEAVQMPAEPGMAFGLYADRGLATGSKGLSPEVLEACHQALARQPSGEIRLGNLLAVSRRGPGCELIGIRQRLPPARPWLPMLAAIYGLSSLVVLRRLQAVVQRNQAMRWSLGAKLGSLLGLGIAFPLLVSATLAWLYTEERWEAITAASRVRAVDRLDRLEAGFEGHLRDQELILRRLSGEFAPAPVDPGQVVDRLEQWFDEGRIDEYYLLSSDSQILTWKANGDGVGGTLVQLLRMPVAERERRYGLALLRGHFPTDKERAMIRDPRPWSERRQKLGLKLDKQHLFKLLKWLSREAINAFNGRRGFATLPAPKGDLVMTGLFAGEMSDFGQLGIGGLNQLRLIAGAMGDNYIFPSIIAGPDGRGACMLLVVYDYSTLTAEYLGSACGPALATAGSGLVALPRGETLEPCFPTLEDGLTWRIIVERLRKQPDTLIMSRFAVGSEAFDLVARLGRRIPDYYLMEVTPIARLEEQLIPIARRAGLLVALAVAFCCLLTWITLQRLLPPIRDLAGGVLAMHGKQFDLRLAADRPDELGRLFGAFNRAMAHLAEMQLAAAIQARILPPAERRVGSFLVSTFNQMTQATGGDFLDHFLLPDGRLVIVLGDVTGHGIGAALVTAMAKEAIRELCPLLPDRPEAVLERINLLFREILDRTLAMTCVLGVLDPATGRLRLANAGQSHPLLWRSGRPARFIELVPGFPLGLARRGPDQSVEVDLQAAASGELEPAIARADSRPARRAAVVFYTDGLIEAIDGDEIPFGYERFTAAVGEALSGPESPVPAIFASVRRFSGSVPWGDDASVLCLLLESPVGGPVGSAGSEPAA